MGNSQAKNVPVNEGELAQRYKLTADQIHALVEAFRAGADSKDVIDEKHFIRVIGLVRASHPELTNWDDELAGMVFAFCDTDHTGKLSPFEVIAALAVFSAGNVSEKATLVFKTIDRDNSGTLSKDEVKKHARKVLSFSAGLVKADLKSQAKEADLGAVGSMAAWAVGTALGSLEKQFAEDIVKDVFTLDADHDDKISLNEWIEGSRTSATVKALIDPKLSGNVWRTLFAPDNINEAESNTRICMMSPKGLAFLLEMEEQAVTPLQPTRPQP